VLRSALVRRDPARVRVGFGALALLAAAMLLAPAGSGADPTSLRDRVDALRRQSSSLDWRMHSAVLDLYALESQLAHARGRLASLQTETAAVRAQEALVRRQVAITRQALTVSQRRLARHLRALYEHGTVDPLAVILGSTSLDQALTSIDALDHAAAQSESIVAQTTATRTVLHRLAATLAARRARLAALEADAARLNAALEQNRGERASYLASLRSKQHLAARSIARLERTARAAEARAEQLAAATAARPADEPQPELAAAAAPPLPEEAPADPAVAGRTLSVVVTGYSMHGRTATGVPTGWGVAAVDPAVIPLGTRFAVPGYGAVVAADTGGAVRGATIDLWFPTLAQARAWGRRTVTIRIP